jgi:hypothetical protein
LEEEVAETEEVPPPLGVESPAEFLEKLAIALREKDGVDAGLADILEKHLLTVTPAVDAVTQAKAAILKLAGERANPPASESAHA